MEGGLYRWRMDHFKKQNRLSKRKQVPGVSSAGRVSFSSRSSAGSDFTRRDMHECVQGGVHHCFIHRFSWEIGAVASSRFWTRQEAVASLGATSPDWSATLGLRTRRQVSRAVCNAVAPRATPQTSLLARRAAGCKGLLGPAYQSRGRPCRRLPSRQAAPSRSGKSLAGDQQGWVGWGCNLVSRELWTPVHQGVTGLDLAEC